MLSDHERKALRELERQLIADDSEFPQAFDARAQRLDRQHLGVPAKIAITVAVVLLALMLLALMLLVGSLAGALAFACAIGLIWLICRPPHGTRRRST